VLLAVQHEQVEQQQAGSTGLETAQYRSMSQDSMRLYAVLRVLLALQHEQVKQQQAGSTGLGTAKYCKMSQDSMRLYAVLRQLWRRPAPACCNGHVLCVSHACSACSLASVLLQLS
jgi:hypothetical protein